MTTNSQLSALNLKKQKQNKLSKQLKQEPNHRNGDHMDGYQWGGGGVSIGNKKHNWQVQNRQGQFKNSIRNGEAKEFVCTNHGHELRGRKMLVGEECRVEGDKGEEKMGQL